MSKETQTKTTCLVCGEEGMIGGCTECGKIKQIYSAVSKQEADKISTEIKRELKELFNPTTLCVSLGKLDEPQMNSYVAGCMQLIENAKNGKPLNRSIIVASPNRYGKTILQKTIKYYYANAGIPVSKFQSFEEVMNKMHRLLDGRSDNDAFLTGNDLFLLKIILPNQKSRNDLALFYTMMELYSKPSIVFISTENPAAALPSLDLGGKASMRYKIPNIISLFGRKEKV